MVERDQQGRVISPRKWIDGELHKRCDGPGHDEPTWLPATEKYFYVHKSGPRVGKLLPRCRLCMNWEKLKSPGVSGTVPVVKVRQYFTEGVNRVGMMEFSRRTGVSSSTIRNVLDGKFDSVQKRTVRKIMLEIISMRRKGEARHRRSIRHGSEIRGREEREVKSWRDFNKPNGDAEMERGRRRRAA